MAIPVWGLIPFVLMLASIAVLPLIGRTAKIWERNSTKLILALVLGVPVALWIGFGYDWGLVTHSLEEYVQFIALLFSLFVVSGGLFLAGDIRATPRNNTILIGIGAVLASFIGTTGAAMMLIRPLLNTNREREHKVHTVVFTILICANSGGLLTPLGDPPLYIGLMRGVPFTWTFSMFWEWLFVNALLLLAYYAYERTAYARESAFAIAWDEQASQPLRLLGASNFVWFGVIIAATALLGEWVWIKVAVQLLAAAGSYFFTQRSIRYEDNEFSWHPIIEVAVLFCGIFLTMIPALEFLREHAAALPLNEYTLYGFTGVLSSLLDNAPTYLTFFEMSTTLHVPGMAEIAGVPELYLRAISLGAVTCGALTYIGNGPNFMVKAVAEERGVEMPSFGRYVGWTITHMAPILVVMVMIFISQNWVVRGIGIALTLGLLGNYFLKILRHPLPSEVSDGIRPDFSGLDESTPTPDPSEHDPFDLEGGPHHGSSTESPQE